MSQQKSERNFKMLKDNIKKPDYMKDLFKMINIKIDIDTSWELSNYKISGD